MAAAVSIGIGGMVGAGIFSILGVVAQAAGNAMWLAFAIGGVVALLSTYSYAKLGATFPSAGGAVHFLVKGFGNGVFAGGLNRFMWAGYIISLATHAATGLWFIKPENLSPALWPEAQSILFGAGVLFIGYDRVWPRH